MENKVRCGEGRDCAKCQMIETLMKMGMEIAFPINKDGRCYFFVAK